MTRGGVSWLVSGVCLDSGLHQLTTFRVHTGSPAQRTATLWRFARMFTSQLGDVYR